MRSKLLQVCITILALLLLAGCTFSRAPQIEFDAIPWADGESSRYDALRRDGSLAGSAVWTWQATPEGGWRQAYSMRLDGRDISGWVELDDHLTPLRSQRINAGRQIETQYSAGHATVSSQNEEPVKISFSGFVLDNDSSLQQIRAAGLAEHYRATYANFVPTSAVVTMVKVTVRGQETVEVPAGRFDTWHVVLDFDSGKHDAWYDVQAPHLLIRYVNNTSGSEFQLRSWQANADAPLQGNVVQPDTTLPEDENYLPAMNRPFLAMSFLIQYPLMLLYPLLLGWWLKRHLGTGWGLFGYGAMIFVASQVVHLPLNNALGLLNGGHGLALLPLPLVALSAGLSAALCEELSRWVALRFLIKNERGWKSALQLGAGHGAAEAIIFGLLALSSVVNLLVVQSTGLAQLGLSGEAAVSIRVALADLWSNPWYIPLVAGLERLFAIACHMVMTVLVMRSFTRRKIGWLGAAIAFHTLLDFWAVWASARLGTLATEFGLAVLAGVAVWLIIRLRDEDTAQNETASPAF